MLWSGRTAWKNQLQVQSAEANSLPIGEFYNSITWCNFIWMVSLRAGTSSGSLAECFRGAKSRGNGSSSSDLLSQSSKGRTYGYTGSFHILQWDHFHVGLLSVKAISKSGKQKQWANGAREKAASHIACQVSLAFCSADRCKHFVFDSWVMESLALLHSSSVPYWVPPVTCSVTCETSSRDLQA